MSDAATTPGKQRRAPRWLWIGFFVSLALNLLIIGAAGGAIWHFKASKKFREAGAPRHFGAFLRRLPAERRDEFRSMFRSGRPELRPLRDEVRSARQAAEEAFALSPFDREKFEAANQRLHEARAKLRGAQSAMFPRIAEMLTAEERKQYLEWRRKHWRRWRRWRRHHDDDGPRR